MLIYYQFANLPMSKKNTFNQYNPHKFCKDMKKTSLYCRESQTKIKSENQLGVQANNIKGSIFCSLKKINYPNNLASNLEVINSQSYQDLAFKLRILKQEKQAVLAEIRKQKKERKHEVKNLFKDKAKIKMDIWEKIGVVCRLKEQILVQKQRSEMLHEFLGQGVTNFQDQASISDQNMLN